MDNFSSLFGDDSLGLGLEGLESFGSQPQATPVPVTEETPSAFQPSPAVSQSNYTSLGPPMQQPKPGYGGQPPGFPGYGQPQPAQAYQPYRPQPSAGGLGPQTSLAGSLSEQGQLPQPHHSYRYPQQPQPQQYPYSSASAPHQAGMAAQYVGFMPGQRMPRPGQMSPQQTPQQGRMRVMSPLAGGPRAPMSPGGLVNRSTPHSPSLGPRTPTSPAQCAVSGPSGLPGFLSMKDAAGTEPPTSAAAMNSLSGAADSAQADMMPGMGKAQQPPGGMFPRHQQPQMYQQSHAYQMQQHQQQIG
ncbi:proline-rich protein 2-like [Pollicipes pollicipes]|uniref:proline-rich protein 2-like n=1 Tax=Pollicipes pollicipes TaxID=41117 RepID=UPI0018849F14|nr:proline-rich protein 2-like [Pollicipes pollicipes]